MIKWRRGSILDFYSLVVGGFLFVSPWLFASVHGIMGHDAWVSSVLIVSLSVTALVAFAEWEEWGLLTIGLWLAMSPWVLGFHNATAMKVNVGVGLVVAYLAAMDLWLIHYDALPPLEPR